MFHVIETAQLILSFFSLELKSRDVNGNYLLWGKYHLTKLAYSPLFSCHTYGFLVTPVLKRINRKDQLKIIQGKKNNTIRKSAKISAECRASAYFPVIIYRETDIMLQIKISADEF